MGYALVSEGKEAPKWPHILCAGEAGDCAGRGWAWHDDDRCHRCFSGIEVAASAITVANAIDGHGLPGIDRLLAIVKLREDEGSGIIRKIFRNPCPVCDKNHLELANQSIRVASRIDESTIPILREANVPLRLLRYPRIIYPGDIKKEVAREGIPVHVGDRELTRKAQAAFAAQFKLKKTKGRQ